MEISTPPLHDKPTDQKTRVLSLMPSLIQLVARIPLHVSCSAASDGLLGWSVESHHISSRSWDSSHLPP